MGRVRRAKYGLVASLLVASTLLQIIRPGVAFAYGQITERSISMSSSLPSDTSVSYQVRFKAGTTGTVKSIAVDFCANNPIIGDSCTANPGTTTPVITSATVATSGTDGNINAGDTWTVAAINTNRTVTLTSTTGISLTAGTSYFFTLNGLTNPSALGTFYARILTFANDTTSDYADAYTGTNLGANIPVDAGGIALSTANSITITAKVQERIVFCVYVTDEAEEAANEEEDNNCTAKDGSDITLGDTNGVLDTPYPFVDKRTRYTVSTNASMGVSIRVKGDTLTSGSNTISPNLTPATSVAGTEQFGLCTYESDSVSGGLSASAKYDGGAGSECSGTTQTAGTATGGGHNSAEFAFDTNATNGTTSTYGDEIAVKAAGDFSTGTVVFIGNVSNATEAGIYKTTLMFIATGTF